MRIYLYAAVFVLLVIYAAAALVTVDRRPADKQIASLVGVCGHPSYRGAGLR